MTRFQLIDRRFNQTAEFLALLFGDCSLQVLDLGQLFADEHNEGHIRDAADPGIADELWIKRQKAFRLFRIPAGSSLPVDQAVLAIELTDCINIRNEFITSLDGRVSLS